MAVRQITPTPARATEQQQMAASPWPSCVSTLGTVPRWGAAALDLSALLMGSFGTWYRVGMFLALDGAEARGCMDLLAWGVGSAHLGRTCR